MEYFFLILVSCSLFIYLLLSPVEYTISALIDQSIHKLTGQEIASLDLNAFEQKELARLGMPKGVIMRHRLVVPYVDTPCYLLLLFAQIIIRCPTFRIVPCSLYFLSLLSVHPISAHKLHANINITLRLSHFAHILILI